MKGVYRNQRLVERCQFVEQTASKDFELNLTWYVRSAQSADVGKIFFFVCVLVPALKSYLT